MAKQLTAAILSQISDKRIKPKYVLKINGVDRTAYLLSHELGWDRSFGSSTAQFVLNNQGGVFGAGGTYQIYVGDLVEFSEFYQGDSTEFKKFYGTVEQRSIEKSANSRLITLSCLDYINLLQKTDISYVAEGTKVKITEETLEPNFLPAPNDALAHIYNFANSGVSQEPPPIIRISPKDGVNLVNDSPQLDGFDVKYAQGQLLMGTPLNARDNYDVIATYYFYTQGVFLEDIIEAILTQEDGYGSYLFGETSADDVIANHLTETFYNVENTYNDLMTPNFTSSNITIKTQMTADFDPDASGSPVLYVEDTSGFPTSGSGSVNGDAFSWTGKTATSLTGITGLSAKPEDSYVQYEANYSAGQVWYLSYSNLTAAIDSNDITGIPSGVSVDYVDVRYGRVILSSAIPTNSTVIHTENYTFKTLQATGVEVNKISFNPRDIENRFEAIRKVREYLSPNYIIRTIGDNKIWSSYLYQRTTADYDLTLASQINYLEDEDLYTRVVFYGKNENPTNIMFREGVTFVSTGVNYKATAVQNELTFEKEDGNYLVYKSSITDAGYIDPNTIKPIVYINNVPVNDTPSIISLMPVVVAVRERVDTTTESDGKNEEVTTRQYFYYRIRFAHTSIDPTQSITLYDAVGATLLTISPGDGNMNYAAGVYNVPGESQNSTIEQVSTASYTVFYSTSGVDIDYQNVRFRISKQLVPSQQLATITATYQYWTALTPVAGIGLVIDGRHDTQVQSEFFAEPPTGLEYAILDLGAVTQVQAVDIIAGFYRPDDVRKFNVDMKFTLNYSIDGVDYFTISDTATNISLEGGDSVSLEEDDLGVGFQARYIKIILESVKKLEYKNGIWPVAFSEVSAYDDIIIKSEAKLIPTTELLQDVDVTSLDSSGQYPGTIIVADATGFTIPESGETATAYIGEDSFTYTGIESGNTFVGVEGLSEDHSEGDLVVQELVGDSTIYDYDGLLPRLGDRLYKEIKVSDDLLFNQTQLDRLARAWLAEFYKNHNKIKVDVLYAPYLQIGQTISVTDPYNDHSSELYFIESISDSRGFYSLTLGKYAE